MVTGAAGGVGSVAVALLAKRGYQVTASTGRTEEADYLQRARRRRGHRPRGAVRTGAPARQGALGRGIDTVGSTTLANVLSMTRYGGAVAACGLAGGMDLPTTVAPFILRGVSLLGIDSVMCPQHLRREAWTRLESDLDRRKLAKMTDEIGLDEVIAAGQRIVEGQVRGRIVVKIG